MISIHDRVTLAERSVSSHHGEFDVSIDSVAIQRAGLELLVKWSVHHKEHHEEQSFIMDWSDPVLERLGYSHEVQELDLEKFARTLLFSLVVVFNPSEDQTTFSFVEENTEIGKPLHWDEDGDFFVR
jgi:hypothetical protein